MVTCSPRALKFSRIIEGKFFNPKLHHEDNPSHKKIFSKDNLVITLTFLSINLLLWEASVKASTNVKFCGNIQKFELIPGVGQQ